MKTVFCFCFSNWLHQLILQSHKVITKILTLQINHSSFCLKIHFNLVVLMAQREINHNQTNSNEIVIYHHLCQLHKQLTLNHNIWFGNANEWVNSYLFYLLLIFRTSNIHPWCFNNRKKFVFVAVKCWNKIPWIHWLNNLVW